MFDLAWSEIALIGVVALVAIGPKDMPVAIKAVTDMIKKARRMAAEFQTHVDDMVRDANLNEVRDQFNELRTMDVKSRILSAVDGDHTIRKALNDDPFATPSTTHTAIPGATGASATVTAAAEPMPTALPSAEPAVPIAPAFIPPAEAALAAPPVPAPPPPAPPAFIPPGAGGHAA